MKFLRYLWASSGHLIRRRRVDAELDAEFEAYLELAAGEYRRRGMPEAEAMRRARIALGGREQVKDADRAARAGARIQSIARDVRDAARSLGRSPAFTGFSVSTLAVGIAASTIMFAVLDAVLLRPLPYPESDRLVWVWSLDSRTGREQRVSYPDFLDWRARASTLDLAGYGGLQPVLTGEGPPQRLEAEAVLGDLFGLLGVSPFLGEWPREVREDGDRVIAMSYRLWVRLYASDPGAVGRSVTLDGTPFTIAAVMPEDFRFPIHGGLETDLWMPIARFNPALAGVRDARLIEVVGRLRPGTSLEQASAEMETVASNLRSEFPPTNRFTDIRVVSSIDEVAGDSARVLLAVAVAVGTLLLMSGVNAAHLFLTRTVARSGEIALRIALGARKRQIVGPLVVESLILGVSGGVVGLGLAVWGIPLLGFVLPADFPRIQEIGVRPSALGFALTVSVVVGVLAGLLSGWHGLSGHLSSRLEGRGNAPPVRRLSRLLVAGEVALSMTLVVSGAVVFHSFAKLGQSDPGFDPANVLTFHVEWNRRNPVAAFDEVRNRLLEVPGVVGASTGMQLPDRGRAMIEDTAPFVTIEGEAGEGVQAATIGIQPGYFEVLGIPIVSGRGLVSSDSAGGSRVAIINESLARAQFGTRNPIGRRLLLDSWVLLGETSAEIVGVAGDVGHRGLTRPAEPLVYLPINQQPSGGAHMVLRGEGDPLDFVPAVREAVGAVDALQPVEDIQTLEARIARSLANDRSSAWMLGFFSGVSVAIAGTGLYGILAYATARRRREIGIRLVLGAGRGAVFRSVVGDGLVMVGGGIAGGLVAAVVGIRLVERFLFGVTATDPVALAAATLTMLVVAVIACGIPARSAMRLDPSDVVREN